MFNILHIRLQEDRGLKVKINMSILNNTTYIEMCDYSGSVTLFVVRQFPSRKYVIGQVLYLFVSGVLIIPTVLLNSISLFTIWKSSHLKEKLCYFLIFLQSIFDVAVGVLSMPSMIALAALELQGMASCIHVVFLLSMAYVPVGASLTTICLLTFERYMSILHPIFHRSNVTKARMLICVCCGTAWFVVTGPVLRVISEKISTALNVIVIVIFLAFNTCAYVKIYLAVKNMRFSNRCIGDFSTEQSSSNMDEKRKLFRERNLAKSCALVVLICYICYLPFAFCFIYFSDDPIHFRVATFWSWIIVTLNSILNSVVFFWKRPLLRQEAMNIFTKITSRK